MKFSLKRDYELLLLWAILILAAFLRFYRLDSQSLWLDELYTLNETDPSLPWSVMFNYLQTVDWHPPLYYVMERLSYMVFGYTEYTARAVSACCGVLGVWAMYILGKELMSKQLGLIASLLTCVNYFSIIYSQEARCYILAFALTIFSYFYFIKLVKTLQVKYLLLYVLFALLLLYAHYFSLFIVASQAFLASILFFTEIENKKRFFWLFAIAGLIIVIGYLPQLSMIMGMSQVKAFWIGPVSSDFAIIFFDDYFGNSLLIKPFLVLLMIYYCYCVFSEKPELRIQESSLLLGFMILFMGIGVTYFIPYLRSILIVPMLYNRYTIVVVPLFIMAISIGIALIRHRAAKLLVVVTLLFLSLLNLTVIKKYYTKAFVPQKTQFREMTQYIAADKGELYSIVEEKTGWHHRYYLKKYGYDVPILEGLKEASIDSILRRTSPRYDLDGFWLVGAHGYQITLNDALKKSLDTAFIMTKYQEFNDAKAQLFIRKKRRSKNSPLCSSCFYGISLVQNSFSSQTKLFYDRKVIPLWSEAITSQSIDLKVGKYSMTIIALGTSAHGTPAQISVYANERQIGTLGMKDAFSSQQFNFELSENENVVFKITLDNDLVDESTGEDRNVFIQEILISKYK